MTQDATRQRRRALRRQDGQRESGRMSDRLEFASAEWVDATREAIVKRFALARLPMALVHDDMARRTA